MGLKFKKFKVWQKSVDLVGLVNELTKTFQRKSYLFYQLKLNMRQTPFS
jgi:hypothetical protein